ncbi:MAG: 5'/3'-nucleotidase SurE [Lentimonas sp.]
MTHKAHVLVTNDDGIHSGFLHCLVEALQSKFKVSVAAPATEQSWIGRAVSRNSEIAVKKDRRFFAEGVDAWSVNGTPTDCVNIALGNLLPKQPDIVVSGINIGYNTTDTLILSSGTVAGAIEGANWGLPAIAFSQYVPGSLFESIQQNDGYHEAFFADVLSHSARHAALLTEEILQAPPRSGTVVNVNFPQSVAVDTQIKETVPAKITLGCLYEETASGVFKFKYSEGIVMDDAPHSDRAALDQGHISRSLLDFSRIGVPNG